MLNVKSDPRKTIFIDIDGVVVPHNYDPETVADILLSNTLAYLKANADNVIVLVTGRERAHALLVSDLLESRGIRIHRIVDGLPTGPRVLINDYKRPGDEPKAVAINVLRNQGVGLILGAVEAGEGC